MATMIDFKEVSTNGDVSINADHVYATRPSPDERNSTIVEMDDRRTQYVVWGGRDEVNNKLKT